MRVPKPRSLEEDWKISVQKAFDDPTRTKAPCEIPEAATPTLVQRVSKQKYDTFRQILRSRNPTTPQEVIGNMASIFAQSRKMTRTQAEDSYTFEVPNSLGFALFVPTQFSNKTSFSEQRLQCVPYPPWHRQQRGIIDLGGRIDSTWRFYCASRLGKMWIPILWILFCRRTSCKDCSALLQPQTAIQKDFEDW